MAIEQVRQCGFRKVGGLYLCGGGFGMECDRLPYELKVCPVCGSGVKFSRGFTWLEWNEYAGNHTNCKCPETCPVCWPDTHPQPYGLLWVGESFYTPEAFIQEAMQMGISRRIAAIPKGLKLGETWILFAHISACGTRKNEENSMMEGIPGVFYAFRPQTVEQLIWESEFNEDKIKELIKKGITPIVIPDGDVDHDPRTSLKPKEEEKNEVLFSNLRDKLKNE